MLNNGPSIWPMGLTSRPIYKYKIPSLSEFLTKEHQIAMDPSSAPATDAASATSAAAPPAGDRPPPPTSSSSTPPVAAPSSAPNQAPSTAPPPNPNPENPQPPPQPAAENLQPSLGRARPLQPPFTHFSPHPPAASSSMASSSSLSSSSSAPSTMPSTAPIVPVQRGMVALGVPATMRPSQPAGGSFPAYGPGSFSQPFGGFSRAPASISEVVSNSGSQVAILWAISIPLLACESISLVFYICLSICSCIGVVISVGSIVSLTLWETSGHLLWMLISFTASSLFGNAWFEGMNKFVWFRVLIYVHLCCYSVSV